jgi:DNA ligase D-like protein (predicted ligase)
MLSDSATTLPVTGEHLYEVKWDGIRALISLEDGQVRIRSRNMNDITAQFPELRVADKSFRATCGLFDAEIVCLDKQGRPEFKRVINRLMSSGESNIQKLARSSPVYCYVFDCLYLDGRSLVNDPLIKRKEWLADAIKKDSAYRVSEWLTEGEALLEAAREHNLEAIMAKEIQGKYYPGKRSPTWLKIKIRNTRECVIIGYSSGKGNRTESFGGLHLAERDGHSLVYRGKVGTGFDDASLKEISRQLAKLKTTKKPVTDKIMDEKTSIWVEPVLMAEVSYASLTSDQNFREPVFIRMRPDLQ